MIPFAYGLCDSDNHFYEPRDAFTRYMEPSFRERAIHVVVDEAGNDVVLAGPDRKCTFLTNPNFQVAVRPGSLREILRNIAAGKDENDGLYEPLRPPYVERTARLALMDEQRMDACLMFPSLGVCVGHFLKDDAPALYANLHAFNRWMGEDWGFCHKERIYATPLLSLLDPDEAVRELDSVLARGARVVALLPGPAGRRSPADPAFDPFWARLNEARVAVAYHIGESGYNEAFSTHWGEAANPSAYVQSALQWTCFYGDRPMMDTVAALIFGNLFGRFPNLRVLSIENGSLWVPYLLKAMDKMYGMGRNGPWIGGRIARKPSQIFREHMFVSPYHEEDVTALVELIGSGHVLFGSDYPHSEGLADPSDFAASLVTLGEGPVRQIMRDNLRGLLGQE
jgi:predicted TIM-barrel fold metal-dependent hydrolase